jgi:hypothetical protein
MKRRTLMISILLIAALLVTTCGCTTSNTNQNSSGAGTGYAGVAVNINSQKTDAQLGGSVLEVTPKPGNEYLILNVTLTNLNRNNLDMGYLYRFNLTTSDGKTYQQTVLPFVGRPDESGMSPVLHTNPGKKVAGEIAFEIPINAKPTQLVYDDNAGNRATTNL